MKKNETIGIYFKIISNHFEHCKNKDLEIFDLTVTQAHILMFLILNKDNVINQRSIEKCFNLSNPTINGILNRLEAKGFIVRVKNEIDARNKEIHVTEKSLILQKEMINKMKQSEKEMLSVLSREEQDELHMLLKRIVNNIKLQKGGKK